MSDLNDFTILQELFKDSVVIKIDENILKSKNDKDDKDDNRIGNAILKENGQTDKSTVDIRITDISIHSVIIKVDDNFPAPDKIFKGGKGERKRADYVIVDTKNKYILCLEIKAGDCKTADSIENQLMGAECFIQYCQKIGQSFWMYEPFLKDYTYRFAAITNAGSINKRPTDNWSDDINQGNSAKSFLKISGNSNKGYHFNQLIGEKSNCKN
jgi:hypothetical protein